MQIPFRIRKFIWQVDFECFCLKSSSKIQIQIIQYIYSYINIQYIQHTYTVYRYIYRFIYKFTWYLRTVYCVNVSIFCMPIHIHINKCLCAYYMHCTYIIIYCIYLYIYIIYYILYIYINVGRYIYIHVYLYIFLYRCVNTSVNMYVNLLIIYIYVFVIRTPIQPVWTYTSKNV